MYLKQLIGCVGLLFLAGCAANQGMQQKVGRLEKDIADLRALQAEQTTQLSALQTDLRSLAGKIEELEYSQTRQVGTTIDTLQRDLTDLQRRVPPPPIVPAAALEQDELGATGIEGEEGRVFLEALASIRLGKYSDALPQLQSVLEGLYDTPQAAYPLFWIGVSFDGLAETNKALGAYTDLTSKFPKHPRAPQSLLRQASASIRLGDKRAAKLTLQKLIAEHAKAPEAASARERLKDLR